MPPPKVDKEYSIKVILVISRAHFGNGHVMLEATSLPTQKAVVAQDGFL